MSNSERELARERKFVYYLRKHKWWSDVLLRLSKNVELDETGRWSSDFREKWQKALVNKSWYLHMENAYRYSGKEPTSHDRKMMRKYYKERVKEEMRSPGYEKRQGRQNNV